MNSHFNASPELQSTLSRLQVLLTQCCAMFATTPSIQEEIGADTASALLDALTKEDGLFTFRATLHQSVLRCLNKPNFEPTRHWQLLEAINFWDGAHIGRWRYMSDPQRQRWIGRSMG